MSRAFPHVNLPALKRFAAATAADEHPPRNNARKPRKPNPQITSCEDVVWAGEKMILISFDKKSLPLGPHSLLAHFPRGRPRLATQAAVGMAETVRACPIPINAPKIYAYRDSVPNDINAEVILLEKVPGECLETVWPTLTSYLEVKVCVKLVELLLKLFNYRGSRISTDLEGVDINTRAASMLPTQLQVDPQPIYGFSPVLQSPPFKEGPLSLMEPQEALTNTTDYLVALSRRMERIFGDPAGNIAARNSGHPPGPPLTDADVSRILDTWHRLGSLIPYHTGGFYIPGTLSSDARHVAYSVLQSREFGIYHSDMQMSRFIVQIIPREQEENPSDPDPEIILTLTGWEHAYRAPLWSCARLPHFLSPRPIPQEPITWERQAYLRNVIFFLMNDSRMLPTSWEWVVGYIFGVPERWFEGCLGSHWMFRDAIEFGLERLKSYWEGWRPDIPFPLEVGETYLGPRRNPAPVFPSPHRQDSGPDVEELFKDSLKALARASGTSSAEWELAQSAVQFGVE